MNYGKSFFESLSHEALIRWKGGEDPEEAEAYAAELQTRFGTTDLQAIIRVLDETRNLTPEVREIQLRKFKRQQEFEAQNPSNPDQGALF